MNRLFAILPWLLAVALAGCANYPKAWEAAADPPEGGWKDLSGAWQGEWSSPGTKHDGPLWCIATPDAEDPSRLHCWYRAGWGRLKGNFRNVATVRPADGGRYAIEGTSRLLFYGSFSLQAEGDPERIDGTYESFGDTGTIRLRRPGTAPED